MNCPHCYSDNVTILESGPHKKLVCQDCYKFIKFLSNADYKVFLALQEKKAKEANGDH